MSLVLMFCLHQVRGTNHNNMKTVQVPEVASSLNSDYVFILKDRKVTTPENSDYESNVWVGKVCTQCCTCIYFNFYCP